MEEEKKLENWKDSYKGKLWSTAVQTCFKAPFVEVAIQHLLKRIDEKHQKEIDLAVSKERERIAEILENNRNETLWGDEESNEVAKKTIDGFIIAVKDELNTK